MAYDPAGPVLLLPGSRKGAVKRIFPVLLAAFARLGEARKAVTLYPSDALLWDIQFANPPESVELRKTTELTEPVKASAVLTTSGTMSMHCALAGIPGVVTYKTDPLTYWMGRLLVKVEYLGIANLLLKRQMYPEYLQGAATAEALATELNAALRDTKRLEQTQRDAAELKAMLSVPASGTVVDWMLRQITN